MEYSTYCTHECPAGKQFLTKALTECESAFDVASDMWRYVDKCISNSCTYQKEREEFDKKNG